MSFFKKFANPVKPEPKAAGSLDELLGGAESNKIKDLMTDLAFLAKKEEILSLLVEIQEGLSLDSMVDRATKILPPIQKKKDIEAEKKFFGKSLGLQVNQPVGGIDGNMVYKQKDLEDFISRTPLTIVIPAHKLNDEGFVTDPEAYPNEEAIAEELNRNLAKEKFPPVKPYAIQIKQTIKELGLYTVAVMIAKNKFSDLRVWIVPGEHEEEVAAVAKEFSTFEVG